MSDLTSDPVFNDRIAGLLKVAQSGEMIKVSTVRRTVTISSVGLIEILALSVREKQIEDAITSSAHAREGWQMIEAAIKING